MSKKPSSRRTIDKGRVIPPPHFAPGRIRVTRPLSRGSSREAYEKFLAFVFDHGQVYNSYLATEPERELFWSESQQGVISYVRRGKHVFCGGGLIAPAEHREQLLQEFLEFTRELSLRPVFFDIQDDVVDLFRDAGFKATKIGEDALVDLESCSFAGKPYEWVRRQTNYCKRNGLVTAEVRREELSPAEWSEILAEVHEVATASISDKPQSKEMRFVVGRLGDHEMGLRRLFVARSDHGRGRIEGFVVLNPMNGGTRWATEIYRYCPDAVRGTIAFVMHQLMEQLKAEGVEQVGLCMIPGRNCEQRIEGDAWLIRSVFTVSKKLLNGVFDAAGLEHFKTRFRPRFENLYVCTPPVPSIGSFWTFFQITGVMHLDLRSLLRVASNRFQKREVRKKLSRSIGSE
ncbi:MAG: DUF2156 domain-containing protein [Planctomycetaceae bacterium]|nr:DUF2156 domain-containing protein [Planctomycetaceae bacterium]